MTGPEHYKAAEDLLAISSVDEESLDCSRADLFAEAQVHATLALAAATAWPSDADGQWTAGTYGSPPSIDSAAP